MAVFNRPPPGGTENRFHSFWDANICSILELLIPQGEAIRNSNRQTATKNLRPNFGFIIEKICSFRGEERGPENHTECRSELVEKLTWDYYDAPYMLGTWLGSNSFRHLMRYSCMGTNMVLSAITPQRTAMENQD